jgi:hypothetical protein
MKPIVSDQYYVYNHEKRARGIGYWAFIFSKIPLNNHQIHERSDDYKWYPESPNTGSCLPGILYSEAKKRASKDAIKLECKYVYALS